MKLYVQGNNGQKFYLNTTASTRLELANLIGTPWFNLHGGTYHVNQVVAEGDSGSGTTTGAIVGGLIGLLGGPLGVILGGTLGGVIGNGTDQDEVNKVKRFNNSRI